MISSRRSAPYHNHVLTSTVAHRFSRIAPRPRPEARTAGGLQASASHMLLHDRRAGDIIFTKGLSAIAPLRLRLKYRVHTAKEGGRHAVDHPHYHLTTWAPFVSQAPVIVDVRIDDDYRAAPRLLPGDLRRDHHSSRNGPQSVPREIGCGRMPKGAEAEQGRDRLVAT